MPLKILASLGNPRSALILALALSAALATGCTGPRTKRLSKASYEKIPADQDIEIYVDDAGGEKLAIVESDAFAYVDDEIKRKQLDQITGKARSLGGNAVERVRILTKQVQGYTPDERVPFTAWKQGRYELYFMRADVTRRQPYEPETIDEARPKGGWVVETLDKPYPLRFDITEIPLPAGNPAETTQRTNRQGYHRSID